MLPQDGSEASERTFSRGTTGTDLLEVLPSGRCSAQLRPKRRFLISQLVPHLADKPTHARRACSDREFRVKEAMGLGTARLRRRVPQACLLGVPGVPPSSIGRLGSLDQWRKIDACVPGCGAQRPFDPRTLSVCRRSLRAQPSPGGGKVQRNRGGWTRSPLPILSSQKVGIGEKRSTTARWPRRGCTRTGKSLELMGGTWSLGPAK